MRYGPEPSFGPDLGQSLRKPWQKKKKMLIFTWKPGETIQMGGSATTIFLVGHGNKDSWTKFETPEGFPFTSASRIVWDA